jgi:phosphocarrier protein HPr
MASLIQEVVVKNERGLHARPAARFVKIAGQFQCDIFVEKDGEKVNGKSILGLMMLAAGPGSRLRLHADGSDAPELIRQLEAFLGRRGDEE